VGKTEEPKVAVSNDRWTAFKHCLVPLAPVPISVVIVTLNFIHFFLLNAQKWTQQFINEVQNALQFAAHAHAMLIVASVAAIVLHRIRYELSEKEGIPFGCVLTGYQLGHPMTLFTKEFWMGILGRRAGQTRLQHYSLVALIVWAIFVTNTAGPLTAIAIIPKLNWRQVSPGSVTRKEAVYAHPYMRAYVTNASELWPTYLTASQFPDGSGECLTATAVQNESCPAGGYTTIAEAVPNFDAMILGGYNITFFNDGVSRNLASSSPPFLNSTAWTTSSIGQVLARSLGLFNQWADTPWKLSFADKNDRDLLKPVVQVACNSTSSTPSFPYNSFVYPPLSNLPSDTKWTANGSELLRGTNPKPVQFTWVDLSTNGPGPSLGAFFRLGNLEVAYTNQTANPSVNYIFNDAIFACSIDARWTPVKPFMTPYFDNVVGSDYVSELEVEKSVNFKQIRIDPSWAQALNVPVPDSSLTTMESLINVLPYVATATFNSTSYGTGFLSLVEAAIGLTVTDGLSRIGWNDQFAFIQSNNDGTSFLVRLTNNGTISAVTNVTAPLPKWLTLDLSISHFGYSYSTSTVTVKIAIVVLLLHVLVAVIHTLVVCVPRHVWTSESWSSIGQLLALALNSRPNRENLANSCAGVNLTQTWGQSVKIREVEDDHLEIVVGQEQDEKSTLKLYDKPRPGKVYGKAACEFDAILRT
jgi:hypothetical protein